MNYDTITMHRGFQSCYVVYMIYAITEVMMSQFWQCVSSATTEREQSEKHRMVELDHSTSNVCKPTENNIKECDARTKKMPRTL